MTWQAMANCLDTDPEIFFSDSETYRLTAQTIKKAKAVCQSCDVRNECLEYAVQDIGLMGIWGGTTSRERIAMRRTASIVERQPRIEPWKQAL